MTLTIAGAFDVVCLRPVASLTTSTGMRSSNDISDQSLVVNGLGSAAYVGQQQVVLRRPTARDWVKRKWFIVFSYFRVVDFVLTVFFVPFSPVLTKIVVRQKRCISRLIIVIFIHCCT